MNIYVACLHQQVYQWHFGFDMAYSFAELNGFHDLCGPFDMTADQTPCNLPAWPEFRVACQLAMVQGACQYEFACSFHGQGSGIPTSILKQLWRALHHAQHVILCWAKPLIHHHENVQQIFLAHFSPWLCQAQSI